MSALLKLIEDFPRGRSTREIMRLLDIDRSPIRRAEVQSELTELLREGLIEIGKDRKWRSRSRRLTSQRPDPPTSGPVGGSLAEPLRAAPVRLHQARNPSISSPEEVENDTAELPDPAALLRYYKAALRSDPRGALVQSPDRHGTAFQIVSGSGKWWGEDQHTGEIRANVNSLPDSFREALTRRAAEDQALAVGWPIHIGTRSGAPSIIPVGLFAASWELIGEELVITLESDDVLLNPEWLRAAARTPGWTRKRLEEVFATAGSAGLEREDFRSRLREAAARSVRGPLHGTQPVAVLEPDAEGIHDALGLFLPTETSFTAGAVRDLDRMSNWSEERLAGTALAPLLGLATEAESQPIPSLNTGPLNAEQCKAVQHSTSAQLTVVTGPPGTGKSQAIVAMAASAVSAGQSVLVASKNHQALDAVEERLGGIAKSTPFMVRTLDPNRDVDQDMRKVLEALIRDDSSAAGLPPDEATQFELAGLSDQRQRALNNIDKRARLHCQIADYHDRRDAIVKARRSLGQSEQDIDVDADNAKERALERVIQWLISWFKRKPSQTASTPPVGMSLAQIDREIRAIRNELNDYQPQHDPVEITNRIAELAPGWVARFLSQRCTPGSDTTAELNSALADLELHGEQAIDRTLTEIVVHHRPLWLASILGTPKRIGLHDALFDLVIFDEASQCDIGSALPLLARARRAVVVGDAKQLAFISQIGAAQDRNLMAAQGLPSKGMGRFAQGSRSLFSLAEHTPGAAKITLRDQYRSAEDIVGYINNEFYRGKLRVAGDQGNLKTPSKMKSGLAWTDVSGRRPAANNTGNVNPAEIDAICSHLRSLLVEQNYQGSIGVISPFRPQVQALEAAIATTLSEKLRKRAELRVGTVDAFQGQERDLILFSPTLHQDSAQSAVTFLNRDARRLNVAISRARAVAHVFGDKNFAKSGKVRRLASLLDRVENPRGTSGEGVYDSEPERIVAAALERRGVPFTPQYAIAGRRLDFALFGTSGIKLDLEVDGRLYHQDTDGNRKLDDHWRDHQMKSLGWKVRRFWVDELKQDLEGCIDLVEQDLLG
ncbi:ATP-dependent RecD-like DNA helicase [Aliiroseovarius sp. xm-v-225]|nr:ATP-dependent RecD-like DNA helicase [Aliiroseovarius sp. xm-m-378]NRP66800.1 ATP-dependent RecD-like DNA helicase [Aliiroseovarius sp. xm-v-225]NRP93864.1 ATP-dependent RecD-like DNA helicase [Aliiroseovarius sp. xm-a-134]